MQTLWKVLGCMGVLMVLVTCSDGVGRGSNNGTGTMFFLLGIVLMILAGMYGDKK